jgi:hypothetical protein
MADHKRIQQTQTMMKRFIISVVTVFVVLSVVFFVLKKQMPGYDFVVLETGNVIMGLLSLTTWLIVKKQMNGRAEAFVRGVYSASFLKLMVCMISILVYVLLNRDHIHKQSVFVLFGIYIIYTTMETLLLSKFVKE